MILIIIYTCQLFSELNRSELVAGASARAATTVNADASEARLGWGLLVLRFHEHRKEKREERIIILGRKRKEEGKIRSQQSLRSQK